MKKKKVNLQKIEKLVATFTILFLVLQIVSPVLLYPRKAQAILGVGDQTFATIVANIPEMIWRAISKTLKTTADVIFKNLIKKYLNQLAYNAALKIATGETGQKPMFLTKPGQLLLDVADNTFGDYIDQFARDWSEGTCGYSTERLLLGTKCRNDSDCTKYTEMPPELPGATYSMESPNVARCIKPYFSLCEPIDVGFKLKLVLWAKSTQKPTAKEEEINYQAKCPVSGMIANAERTLSGLNYDQYLRELEKKSPRDYLREVSKGLNPEATELGQYLITVGKAEEAAEKEKDLTKFTQSLEGQWKSLTTKITKEVLTPASTVGKTFESMMPESIRPYLHQTGSAVADALGVFFNTLTSKLLKQVYEKGFNPRAKPGGGGGGAYAGIPTGGVSTGIAAAESMFASLNKPDYNVSGTTDILSELASCPSTANINNCVIDDRFRLAIEQKKTVRQAIEEGLIDGSKTFGYDAVTQKDPDYRSGYPLRSLLILRKYRIIPVGWELAAKYIKQYAPANYGLKEIMDNYDNCGQCSLGGQTCRVDSDCSSGSCDTTQSSPFCGLIDSNWVLKIPEVYCKREGAGEKIVSDEWVTQQLKGGQEVTYTKATPEEKGQIERRQVQRMDYCADEQTCIAENEDGSCRKFGYCVEDKPVWKFHGDQCEAYYNTCQVFSKKSGGTETAYLKNTVDFNNCSADNAGCRWYCEDWNSLEKRWTCEAPNLTAAPPEMVGNRINLNGQVGQCDPKAEGCDEFIRTKRGLGTNLMRNSSFEKFEGSLDDGNPDKFGTCRGSGQMCNMDVDCGGTDVCLEIARWEPAPYITTYAVSGAYDGQAALRFTVAPHASPPPYTDDYLSIFEDVGYKQNNRTFTFSFYAKADGFCKTQFGLEALKTDLNWEMRQATADLTPAWQKYSFTYTFPDLVSPAYISPYAIESFIRASDGTAEGCSELGMAITVDAAQLEEGKAASSYKPYGEVNKIYLNGQRTACTADEVGCEKYTPTAAREPITGIITNPSICNPLDPASCDQCPAEYVGCKAYREMPIDHLPYRQATDPISLVASSGKTCPASAVGCEEYTNLDEVAKGGEGLEYFGYIRLCVLPESPDLATYYTWVGTEEFGYQLRAYNLKKSNLDNAPCTNIDVDGWPACGDDLGPPSNVADCSDTCSLDLNPPPGNDTCAVSRQSCTNDQDCINYQLTSNPDCAEFYDQTGDTHYRLKSRIISVSDSCLPYRNTFTSQDRCVDTDGDPLNTPDHCTISGATCSRDGDCSKEACNPVTLRCSQSTSVTCATSNDCPPKIFHIDPGQGIRCQAEYAGCREYVGSAGHNVYTVLQSNFESGSISPWDTNTNPGLNPSNESIQAGGHSMLVASAGGGVSYANTLVDKLINKNKSYILSFWAKGTGTDTVVSASFVSDPAANWLTPPNLPFPGSAALKAGDWNKYSLGPLYHETDVQPGEKLYIFSNTAFYIDNIVLEEVTDDIYLIKNSYTQCSGYENCSQYADRDRTSHYLKSFSKLCKDDKVGCEAVIDTQNSNSPFKEFFDEKGPRLRGDVNGDGIVNVSDRNILNDYVTPGPPDPKIYPYPEIGDVNNDHQVNAADVTWLDNGNAPSPVLSDLVVQDDRMTYAVNDKNKYCKAEEQGCTRLGSPQINQNNEVTGYEDVYMVNDPDQYGKTLCNLAESGCQEWSADNQYYYFKDPGDKTCEYKRQAGASSGGWYKSGSTSTLPDCPVINVGNYTRPASGWVGVCPNDKSGCSEYRDPHEPANCNVAMAGSCDSYFYLNTSIDLTGCNGIFNPDKGCLLFADQTQINTDKSIRLTYDSDLTYTNFDNTRKDTQPTVCTGSTICSLSRTACVNNADCPAGELCLPDCDANTIVKVDRDRTCNKWLECRSSKIEKNQKGENEEFCYAFGACNELDPNSGNCIGTKECSNNTANHCANTTEEAACTAGGGICRNLDSVKSNLTFNSPSDVDSVRYMSGSVVGGLSWANNQTIAGYYPYAAMEQIGQGGAVVEDLVVEGDFGDKDLLDGREPSITVRNSVRGEWTLRTCSNNNTIDCARNEADCTAGGGQCGGGGTSSLALVEESKLGQIKTGNQDNLDENNILEVNPGLGADHGAYYNVENGVYGNQQYVVSFRIRYKDEPNDSDKLTVGFAYARAGAPEPAITDFANFITGLHPSTEFKKYVFGPFTANPRGGATYLRFVQQAGSSGRTFYLDDVSLKPVLEANSDPRCLGGIDEGKSCVTNADCTSPGICYYQTKIVRSCRMYPKSDAPLCTYTDEKAVTYRGWYGYCIEKDPINPQYCLNWWPVDIIAGESNVFGQEEEFSYTGRVPLYMCMQGRGNYNKGPNNSEIGYKVLHKDTWPTQLGGIVTGGCNYFNQNAIDAGYTFFVCSAGGAETLPTPPAILDASHPESHINESDIEKVKVTAVANFGNDGMPNEFTFQPPLQRPNFQRVVDPVTGAIAWMYQNHDWAGFYSGTDWLSLNLNFNAQGQLVNYWIWHNDETDDGSCCIEGAYYNVTFYLREACTKIAQVADTELTNTKPWARRIESSSNYVVPNLRYNYEQDYSPYGGAKEPSNISPVEWDTRPYEDGKQPLYVESILTSVGQEGQVRAGSPYSCEGQCGGGMCLGGNESASCARNFPDCCDNPDIPNNTCNGNQGLCVGVQLPTTPPPAGDICYDARPVCGGTTPDTFATNRVERLFAKPIDVWEWNASAGNYDSGTASANAINTSWDDAYNNMIPCVGGVRPAYPNDYCGILPQVRYVSVTAAGEICNTSGCSKDIPNNTYAQISFDVSVNEEQVPLKRVYIDWDGDGTADQIETGNFPSGRRTFNYKLACSGGGPVNFSPRIRIRDNWDWCNAGSGPNPGGSDNRDIGTACDTWYDPGFTFRCTP